MIPVHGHRALEHTRALVRPPPPAAPSRSSQALVPALGVAALMLVLALVALRIRARRQARRARVTGRRAPRHPVVLAHGVMGFEAIKLGPTRHEYFRGVPKRLRRLGTDVYTIKVSPSASIATRAQQLAEAVRQLPAERVNIIAHSMGGLDARYAIAKLGLAAKVASLTTVGTPHRGTPIADVGTKLFGEKLKLRKLVGAIGLDMGAFYDCTVEKMKGFNQEVPDARGVAYHSFVAKVPGRIPRVNALLLPAYLYLAQQMGENDGVVPASSQAWGDVLGHIEADHWAQIGWSLLFDAPEFYAGVVQSLRERDL